MSASLDGTRGIDHGVFVPLKVAFPDADIPVVEMSTDLKLDPAEHLAAGRALAPLRDEGVLVVGAGMSFHNMRGYGRTSSTEPSRQFDAWLGGAATADADTRSEALMRWAEAPSGRFAHPREEHLLPLMVAAGASEAVGERIYNALVMETAISGFRFA
jgi:aromatic ring-opening dioxygenase catalytic subunit (LigB family)